MKINNIAPYLLDYSIQYLKTKVVGTKYRPEANTFLMDPRLLCRIIKHDGNLYAKVNRKDVNFCTVVMKEWVKSNEIKLPFGRGTYRVKEDGADFDYRVVIKRNTLFGGKEDVGKLADEIISNKAVETRQPVANDC